MARLTLDDLKHERDSVNNRISGVKTQLKRIDGDDSKAERRSYLEERLDTLTRRRDELAAAINERRIAEQRARDAGRPLHRPRTA